jgi:hypothetical protein
MELMKNIEKYFKEILEHDDHGNFTTKINYKIAYEVLDEDELKVLILFTTMLDYMNTTVNAETMDMAEKCLNELKAAELDNPLSSTFINSIFNFNNVYTPLYDLLDLATNGRFRGESVSNEYRLGVIDSIVALRRYQRTHGLGDHEWELPYNTASFN